MVTAADNSEQAKKGIFSYIRGIALPNNSCTPRSFSSVWKRLSGQKSIKIITTGRVTSIGLDIRPSIKEIRESMYRAGFRLPKNSTYKIRVRNQKNALRTSFLSATQATDSTCKG